MDARLACEKHVNAITTNENETIELLRKLQKHFSETGINDYKQRFCETTSKLW